MSMSKLLAQDRAEEIWGPGHTVTPLADHWHVDPGHHSFDGNGHTTCHAECAKLEEAIGVIGATPPGTIQDIPAPAPPNPRSDALEPRAHALMIDALEYRDPQGRMAPDLWLLARLIAEIEALRVLLSQDMPSND